MRYGLYLTVGNDPFKGGIQEVEGYLIPPGAMPIGVWVSLQWKGSEIKEVLPCTLGDEERAPAERLDQILRKCVERVKTRIALMKELETLETEVGGNS
jgi:hypothetical protein